MKGKLFRLGHMGHYTDDDIRDLIAALERTLGDLGWTDRGGALEAANRELEQESQGASA